MARPVYSEVPPGPGLASLVLCAWQFEVPAAAATVLTHAVPPDGCTSLVWTPGEVLIMGPRLEPFAVPMPPGSVARGLRLWPDATFAVTGIRAEALRGRVVPVLMAAPALGVRVAAPCEVTPAAPEALDPLVRALVRAIVAGRGAVPLGVLAASVGRSERQVQRRFRREVGLTIKEFARIRRFREAGRHLLEATPKRWGEVAYEVGYADQAHLSREFSALMGQAPEAYRRWVEGMEHRDVRP